MLLQMVKLRQHRPILPVRVVLWVFLIMERLLQQMVALRERAQAEVPPVLQVPVR